MKDFTKSGMCSNCGNCCSDILHLDNDEIKKIDNFLKKHKVVNHSKKENLSCPFRNEVFKKCDIYEVRPYICKMFKCNVSPAQAYLKRDEINKGKRPRSMSELFFKDDTKIKMVKDRFKIKVYKRGEW